MLDRSRSRIGRTYEIDVLSTDNVLEEGLALTSVIENNVAKARRSNGVDNTIFLGVSWGDRLGVSAITSLPKIITATAGAANSGGAGFARVSLGYTSTGTPDMTVINGAGYGAAAPMTPVAIGAGLDTATEYGLDADGRSIVVINALAGTQFFIAFRYAPTAVELVQRFGDVIWPQSSTQLHRIGVIATGDLYTTNFDTSVDWSTIDTLATAEVLRAGPNGRFTVNAAGAICRNTMVIAAPTAAQPFLGIKIEN